MASLLFSTRSIGAESELVPWAVPYSKQAWHPGKGGFVLLPMWLLSALRAEGVGL
jgi:hypothetical protein